VTNILTNKQSNIIISEEERRKSLQLKSKNAIMNELIKEYLSFNAYYHTNDVF
jgi:signal transduction histidine kinase